LNQYFSLESSSGRIVCSFESPAGEQFHQNLAKLAQYQKTLIKRKIKRNKIFSAAVNSGHLEKVFHNHGEFVIKLPSFIAQSPKTIMKLIFSNEYLFPLKRSSAHVECNFDKLAKKL